MQAEPRDVVHDNHAIRSRCSRLVDTGSKMREEFIPVFSLILLRLSSCRGYISYLDEDGLSEENAPISHG